MEAAAKAEEQKKAEDVAYEQKAKKAKKERKAAKAAAKAAKAEEQTAAKAEEVAEEVAETVKMTAKDKAKAERGVRSQIIDIDKFMVTASDSIKTYETRLAVTKVEMDAAQEKCVKTPGVWKLTCEAKKTKTKHEIALDRLKHWEARTCKLLDKRAEMTAQLEQLEGL